MLIAAGFLLGLSAAARSDEDHSQVELRWHCTADAALSEDTGITDDVPLTNSQTISVNAALAHMIDTRGSAVFYGIGYLQRTVQLEADPRLSDTTSSSRQEPPDDISDHAITNVHAGFLAELPEDHRFMTTFVVQRVEALEGVNPTRDESWTVETLLQRPGWFGMQYELGLVRTSGDATDDTEVLPMLGVRWHDERRGFSARFPDGLHAWHSLGRRLRVELSVALSGYHIRTSGANQTSESITRIDRTDVDVSIGYRLDSG